MRLLCLAMACVLVACSDATIALPTDAAVTPAVPHLYTCVVARVLHDFPSLTDKQWSKVEVFFDGDTSALQPSDIASLYVDGPSGYHLELANVPFAAPAINGYVQNPELGGLWYQAILPGFFADGRYVVSVEWTDGRTETHARTLRARFELLDFYQAHASEMVYTPIGTSKADDTVLAWSTLADLGGPDAYYNAWISQGTTESIDAGSARGDTIFFDALNDPSAGFNRAQSRMGNADHPLPKGPQTWQPEILDSNVLDQVNMIIFPPGQHFSAL